MKKLILIGLLGVMVTSCEKEYMCECTTYWAGGADVTVNQLSMKGTKSEVIKECDAKSIPYSSSDPYNQYQNCKIK
jgi:hypothetical protein